MNSSRLNLDHKLKELNSLWMMILPTSNLLMANVHGHRSLNKRIDTQEDSPMLKFKHSKQHFANMSSKNNLASEDYLS